MIRDSKFDRDPEAIAWAQSRVQGFIGKLRQFEKQAAHAEPFDPERVRRWRMFANLLEMEMIGGTGCVIALFDTRLPAVLASERPQEPISGDNTERTNVRLSKPENGAQGENLNEGAQ